MKNFDKVRAANIERERANMVANWGPEAADAIMRRNMARDMGYWAGQLGASEAVRNGFARAYSRLSREANALMEPMREVYAAAERARNVDPNAWAFERGLESP